MKLFLGIIVFLCMVFFFIETGIRLIVRFIVPQYQSPTQIAKIYPSVSPTSSKPSPTPPVNPTEKEFGPCATIPTLMYHHVEYYDKAKKEGHEKLTVNTPTFQSQMQYLHDHSYNPISMQQLLDFFDKNIPLPPKPVLLTFDDGYEDFATDALPILQKLNYPSTLFLPTAFADRSGYVSWIWTKNNATLHTLIANHTWSHVALQTTNTGERNQITKNEEDLKKYDIPTLPVFAYPYGQYDQKAVNILFEKKYGLAFTTNQGSLLCKGKRLEPPRIRVGNSPLSAYGLN